MMTCTVFNGSWENKLLSCLPALLEPAPADVGQAGAGSCGALEGWRGRDASSSAPGARAKTAEEAPESPLADPQGSSGP